MERAIVLPFSVDASGSILSSNEPSTIWKTRVISAVMTELGERVFRPQYGGSIQASLNETQQTANTIIRSSVEKSFSTSLQALTLVDINVLMDSHLGTISVTIYYTLPSGESDEVSVKSGYLTRSGEIIQEF